MEKVSGCGQMEGLVFRHTPVEKGEHEREEIETV